jgi:Ca-activated chloride channel family protein
VTAAITAVAVVLGACTREPSRARVRLADPGRCLAVDVVAAPELSRLLGTVARRFNGSDAARVGERDCAFARVRGLESGEAARHLLDGWVDVDDVGPRPAIWVPASSAWVAWVNEQLAARGEPAVAARGPSLARGELVVAMPEDRARALGWPDRPVGWATLARLAADRRGWARARHPEWGAFRIGTANPRFDTAALLQTLALARPPHLGATARVLERSVASYAESSWAFLDTWARRDRERLPLGDVSAVVTDERTVAAYRTGSRDGLVPRRPERKNFPRSAVAAIMPADGRAGIDYPLAVLDARDARLAAATRAFAAYAAAHVAARDLEAAGLDPGGGEVEFGAAHPSVTTALAGWDARRKRARLLVVFDVSESMRDPSDPKDSDSPSKIALAKPALLAALDELAPDDHVGLRVFTTRLGRDGRAKWADVVPVGPLAGRRDAIARAVAALTPSRGSPLYAATRAAFDAMAETHDPARINGVVLLTDGYNEDEEDDDRAALLAHLHDAVRVVTVPYSHDADRDTLRMISLATGAPSYDATDTRLVGDRLRAAFANF